jgi:hypothetical protein
MNMEDYKTNDLLSALENESNASIMKLNTRKIQKHKNDILQQIIKCKHDLKLFHKKLKYYRYCGELCDLQDGHYIRWIPLKDPEKINLTIGGFYIETVFCNNCLQISCKNGRRRIKAKFDEILIFQKISNQEAVILSVLDYLDKN